MVYLEAGDGGMGLLMEWKACGLFWMSPVLVGVMTTGEVAAAAGPHGGLVFSITAFSPWYFTPPGVSVDIIPRFCGEQCLRGHIRAFLSAHV